MSDVYVVLAYLLMLAGAGALIVVLFNIFTGK
jgi:hypothetical protein